MSDTKKDSIKAAVREHYAEAIKSKTGCCGSKATSLDSETAGKFAQLSGYAANDLNNLPETVASFGCGNPVAFTNVKPGQTVLDLGSGAGLDLILAARKVGPTGKVIGLDMTPEMILTCRRNLDLAGVKNAEVRMGEMEEMPVKDAEVDWIISNCVINLSPDKKQVFAEAFRVLKPGGQMVVSDIVTVNMPEAYRDDVKAWVGCIAGAVEEAEYVQFAKEAGFVDVKIEDRLLYDEKTIIGLASDNCGCGGSKGEGVSVSAIGKYANKVASVRLNARKP